MIQTIKNAIGYFLGYGSCECGKTWWLMTVHVFSNRAYCCDCLPQIDILPWKAREVKND